MKPLLLALVVLVVEPAAHADTSSSTLAKTPDSENRVFLKNKEGTITDYIAFLQNTDGTVTPAYHDTFKGRLIIYRWNDVEIYPREIPKLDSPDVGGLDFNPIGKPVSTPYSQWSGMNVRRIDPPKAYRWDKEAGGFRAGFSDRLRGLFFEIGNRIYQKAQLPSDAQIIESQNVKVITVVASPASLTAP